MIRTIRKSGFVEESNLLVLNKLERLLTVCKVKNIDDIDLSKEFWIFHSLAFFQSCLEYLQIIKLEFLRYLHSTQIIF